MSELAKLTDTELVNLSAAKEAGLSTDEYERAQTILGRVPNKVELGCIASMWSEHCSYKSSRLHLGRLPSEGPKVIQGPGENAGIVDIGDGLGACFKVESHNHPSFIEPFQGAATGVGGILRDVFTMGARPIALGNLLRFGEAEHARTPELVDGVVRGIAHYGNCFGAPTTYTDIAFSPAFNGNILVNAFALGIVPTDQIFLGTAEGVGNPIFYVGAKTGRDGINGATMASDSFSEHEELERPTVQVGDPFREKLLLEACLECFKTDALVGIQDMGAAGLTSSTFEMASRAGAGVDINLDDVPAREEGMTAYEKMLSESQERMVLVAHKGKEDIVRKIFKKWDLDCVEIGVVTDTERVVLHSGGKMVADIPARPLADEAPKYDRKQADNPPAATLDGRVAAMADKSPQGLLDTYIDQPDFAGRGPVLEQFDRHVGVATICDGMHQPAAVHEVRASAKPKYVSQCLVARDDLCALSPKVGAARTVQEAYLRICAMGHAPIGVSDCLNHGNPEDPIQMRAFAEVVDGIAESCKELSLPVVSGNVSLYNETDGRSIWPTPTIAMVGTAAWNERNDAATGDAVVLLGAGPNQVDGATALRSLGVHDGRAAVPRWSTEEVRRVGEQMCDLRKRGASHIWPMVPGGLVRMALELMDAAGLGMELMLDSLQPALLVGEQSPCALAIISQKAAADSGGLDIVGCLRQKRGLSISDGSTSLSLTDEKLAKRSNVLAQIMNGEWV